MPRPSVTRRTIQRGAEGATGCPHCTTAAWSRRARWWPLRRRSEHSAFAILSKTARHNGGVDRAANNEPSIRVQRTENNLTPLRSNDLLCRARVCRADHSTLCRARDHIRHFTTAPVASSRAMVTTSTTNADMPVVFFQKRRGITSELTRPHATTLDASCR
jgi:hypothetical protein